MNIKNNQEIEKNCLEIHKNDLPDVFELNNCKIYLKDSKARPLYISFPFQLDKKIASISGMIMDGSLSKNLDSMMFSQKKDIKKVVECSDIIFEKFNIKTKILVDKRTGTHSISYGRKTLASFFYHCIGIHKSDEKARIPYWILNSPKSVIIAYIRYAYAMEGSIDHYLKGAEVKFHSVSLPYLQDLQMLLMNRFGIKSNIQKYYIKNYGYKYYLMFSKKDDVMKFGKIGFVFFFFLFK
jgi:hypothetical protein